MDQQFKALQAGSTVATPSLTPRRLQTPTAFSSQNGLWGSQDERRGGQSPPVITTVMSPTLKKQLDTKVDAGSFESFKKQVMSEVNALLAKANLTRPREPCRSPHSHSRNESLSHSHAALNRSQRSLSPLNNTNPIMKQS